MTSWNDNDNDEDNEFAFGLNRAEDLARLQQIFSGIHPADASFVFLAQEYRFLCDRGFDPARPDTWNVARAAYVTIKDLTHRALRAKFEAEDMDEQNRILSEIAERKLSPSEAAKILRRQKYSDAQIADLHTQVEAYRRRKPKASKTEALVHVAGKLNMTPGGLRELLRRRAEGD